MQHLLSQDPTTTPLLYPYVVNGPKIHAFVTCWVTFCGMATVQCSIQSLLAMCGHGPSLIITVPQLQVPRLSIKEC